MAPPPPPARDTSWLTSREVAARLRCDMSTLYRWRRRGIGPEWIKTGHRTVLYPLADVQAYEAAQRRGGAA